MFEQLLIIGNPDLAHVEEDDEMPVLATMKKPRAADCGCPGLCDMRITGTSRKGLECRLT